MAEKTNYQKMLDEEEYFPDQELADLAYACSEGLQLINTRPPRSLERQMFLQKFFGSFGSHVTIKGNFNCDYGKNIYIGSGTIINCNVTILDTNRVEIGENVFIAPGVVISAATHPLDAQRRVSRHFQSHPITIKDCAWIGANATILAGVTIGRNAVVTAGAVVTKDVPDNCLVGGIPARVIKEIPQSGDAENVSVDGYGL